MSRVAELVKMKADYRNVNGLAIPFERPPPDEAYAPGHQLFFDEVLDFEVDGSLGMKLNTAKIAPKGKKREAISLDLGGLSQRYKEAKVDVLDDHRFRGSNNRAARGSASERKPHIMLANRFEAIIDYLAEQPAAAMFCRPVKKNASFYVKYAALISKPIDLQTIRKRCGNPSYKYKNAQSFLEELQVSVVCGECVCGGVGLLGDVFY